MKILFSLTALLILFLFTGCSGDNSQTDTRRERVYRKITGHELKLYLISTRTEYYLQEGIPMLRFSLKNEGFSAVSIKEWKAHDMDNIRLFYAPCKKGQAAKIAENAWKEAPRQTAKGTVLRYPIDLGPQNAVLIEVPMSFLSQIRKPGYYAIRGSLDLHSVDLKSHPIEIRIR